MQITATALHPTSVSVLAVGLASIVEHPCVFKGITYRAKVSSSQQIQKHLLMHNIPSRIPNSQKPQNSSPLCLLNAPAHNKLRSRDTWLPMVPLKLDTCVPSAVSRNGRNPRRYPFQKDTMMIRCITLVIWTRT